MQPDLQAKSAINQIINAEPRCQTCQWHTAGKCHLHPPVYTWAGLDWDLPPVAPTDFCSQYKLSRAEHRRLLESMELYYRARASGKSKK